MNLTTEPVLANGSAASLAAAAIPVLVYLGVNANQAGQVGSFAAAALALVLAVWHLFSVRSKVTPIGTTSPLVDALERVAVPLERLVAPPVGAAAPAPASAAEVVVPGSESAA